MAFRERIEGPDMVVDEERVTTFDDETESRVTWLKENNWGYRDEEATLLPGAAESLAAELIYTNRLKGGELSLRAENS